MPAPNSIVVAPAYHRHRPEQTALYSIVTEHYPRFAQEIESAGGYLPGFVRQEFEDYLKCGLLEHGFLRVKCVLTFPFPLRFLLAARPEVLTQVLAVVQRGLSTFVIRHSGLMVSSGARAGAVTLIQRFGSALNRYSVPALEEATNHPLLARAAGFSLHAATVCEAFQRSRLERLCRYITRPPTR